MQDKTFSEVITFTRSTTGTRLNPASGFVETAAIDTPRIEAGGLLFEQQRVNLALRSEEFENVFWGKTRASITANATTAPSGVTTADKLIEDTSTNTHILIWNNFPAAGSTTYTWTIFAKAAERTFCTVQFGGAANLVAGNSVNVNLTTGAFTATDLARTVVTPYPNGWFRISSTVTTIPAGGAISPLIMPAITMGVNNYTGDGASGIYVWGGQLEAGDGPSSYIPTVAAQVTRAADRAFVASDAWLRPGEGTLFVETTNYGFLDVFGAAMGTETGLGNIANFIRSSDRRAGGRLYDDAGAIQFSQIIAGSPVLAPGGVCKAAIAYKSGDQQFSTAGLVSPLGVVATLPTVDRLNLGTRASNVAGNHMTGYIRRIKYFPYRLTAAQLQALTT